LSDLAKFQMNWSVARHIWDSEACLMRSRIAWICLSAAASSQMKRDTAVVLYLPQQ